MSTWANRFFKAKNIGHLVSNGKNGHKRYAWCVFFFKNTTIFKLSLL